MIPVIPSEARNVQLNPSLLIAAANAFVGFNEQGGDNRGQVVERFLAEVHQLAGAPWCAAFVYHVGFHSHFDSATRRSSWPLPATASCEELARHAAERRVLMDKPRVGDVFVLYSRALGRFAHTGIVAAVDPDRAGVRDVHLCVTIEGNTNEDGSRDGFATLRKVRTFREADGHKFIRWTELLPTARKAA
jgi:hypothetical protein